MQSLPVLRRLMANGKAFLEGNSEKAPPVIWDSRVSTSLVTRLESILVARNLRDPKQLFPGIGPIAGDWAIRNYRARRFSSA